MKNAFLLFFNFILLSATAQVELVQSEYDFGMLLRADDNWTDFEIRNLGEKEAIIFRVEGPKNTDIKLSAKTIKPGSSEFIRVAVSPKRVGKFKITLEVYLSAWMKPQTISVSGESSFAASALIPCPDFSKNRTSTDDEFHISVRDKDLNTPIEGSTIEIYQSGRLIEKIASNEYGEADVKLPHGRYFIAIEARGSRLDTALYINAVNTHLLAKIKGNDKQLIANRIESIEKEVPIEPQTKAIVVPSESDMKRATSTIEEPENAVLPLSKFKENNLVFLVDVSASMKQRGKLDLLKIAMGQLLDVLRPADRFALISYSSETKTIIETQGKLDRQACIEAILALEAGGSTAGAKAIKKAGSVALSHFVESGNNQIILATDGAFNEGVDKALRYASRYNRKDIQLSVLGIKCGPHTTRQMTALVGEGGGRFVPIEGASDAGKQLIEEIKKSSER